MKDPHGSREYFSILLREKDCVTIDMCYKPNGDAVFISLGQNENKKIIVSGDSLVGALENAVSEVK